MYISYFEHVTPPQDFLNDYMRVQLEYDEFKARLDKLADTIRKRSDVYNSMQTDGGEGATWMANGTQCPGTWIDPTENNRKGHHAGIAKVYIKLQITDWSLIHFICCIYKELQLWNTQSCTVESLQGLCALTVRLFL
jgi:hypothetical protein